MVSTLPLSPPQDQVAHHSNISGVRCFTRLSQKAVPYREPVEMVVQDMLWTSFVWCCVGRAGARLADWIHESGVVER